MRPRRWQAAKLACAPAGRARRAESAAPSRCPRRSAPVSLAPHLRASYFHPVDVKLLKQAAIFQDLDDGELARVAEVCREQKFTVGQYVFKEGEPGNRLFLISSGEVRISRTIPGSGEEALAVLKPGACFGEMSIFDRSERSTDAIANTACTLITISRSDFELLLDFNRDIAYKVLWSVVRLLSARLRVTNDNLRSFLAMSMF
ncbi:MAG: cyclic nucleotide-binding domain-containing protein [Gemmatimonadetes bacterium]|nr:MAG: cyclic nucleotide-binding domain-containing protein [Gemmatimonadota bacterium]